MCLLWCRFDTCDRADCVYVYDAMLHVWVTLPKESIGFLARRLPFILLAGMEFPVRNLSYCTNLGGSRDMSGCV